MTYKQAFLLVLLIHLLLAAYVLWHGAVIFPHNNDLELGVLKPNDDFLTNRKFSDQSSVYIPEINQHLNGHSRGWLSTWNPHVEFGRPTFQLSGFGKAYLITYLLSFFTNSPFVLYTSLTLLTNFLAGVFCFLFLRTLRLHPLAGCVSAVGLSLGTFFAYWQSFVMFLATLTWTLALLWLIAEFLQRRSLIVAAGIAFATYSLLMTGYPQYVIMQAYLLLSFTLLNLWRSPHPTREKCASALALVGSVSIGVLTTLPVYLDLVLAAQRSARLQVNDTFFLAALPPLQNFTDLGTFLSQLFDPFWYGNVIEEKYPFPFNGVTLTPLYFSLLLLSSTTGQWRTLWYWQGFIGVCLLATLWPLLYLFMVHHLGFHLSRSTPIGGSLIPAFVVAGYTVDHILRKGIPHSLLAFVVLAAPLLLESGVSYRQHHHFSFPYVMLSILITLCLSWFIITRHPILLLFIVGISTVAYGFRVMLLRPLASIQTVSPLTENIRVATDGGFRYALVGSNLGLLLPANQEALLDLRSIQSYNSLSSTSFQQIARQLSATGTTTYGRHFARLDSGEKLGDPVFTYTGVNVFVSRDQLQNEQLRQIASIDGVKLYTPLTSPLLEAQLDTVYPLEKRQRIFAGSLADQPQLPVKKLDAFDDFMRFSVTPADQETLLFVSQQYHPSWRATTGSKVLSMVQINDFYLGVVLPPHVEAVDLGFYPFARWSWLAHVFFSMVAVYLLIRGRFGRWPSS